ncbi:polysaccharide deacetylase [Candidatus Saccharibacteria bacterium]|nr:polysaccharide deacetylase [Candidatus Saccharibacteria bacterium]
MSEPKTESSKEVTQATRKKPPVWALVVILLFAGLLSYVAFRVLTYVPPDVDPPVITLNGEPEVEIALGSETPYQDAGATAFDERDGELEATTTLPEMDIWRAGEYEIKYAATDASGNLAEASRKVKIVAPAPVEGAVYLTFDDGPSEHTARLLDILKKYDVKATFFVVGREMDDVIKRAYDEGHSIGLHTFSHNYAHIYQSTSTFFDDLYAIQNKVKDITGYSSTLMRFPGGSSNTVSALYDGGTRIMSRLVKEVEARGFKYFDWNISSGDAGGATTSEEVYNNVTSRLGPGEWVVLQHDTQGFSVDAVERIIQFGKRNGYQFKALTMESSGAWHGVRN